MLRKGLELAARSWRALGKRPVTAGLVALALVVLGLLLLLIGTPSWYEPPRVAPDQRQQVRNNLVAAEQAFTEGLRAGTESFVYHIYQDDLNRWIAMRREIYPLLDQLTPRELADPFVVFSPDGITVAGLYRAAGTGVVLSVDISVVMQNDAMVLQARAAHVGLIRVPLSWAGRLGLAEQIEREPGAAWPGSPRILGNLLDGLEVGHQARWKNGGVLYRVLDVSSEPGILNLTIKPLGRQEPKEHKHHASSSSPTSASANRPERR